LIHEMLPAVAVERLARFADVFCEPGVFTVDEAREILVAASAAGLGLKLHADELTSGGGAELAASLGATSADHLAAISDPGFSADLALWAIDDARELPYWLGGGRCHASWTRGKPCHPRDLELAFSR